MQKLEQAPFAGWYTMQRPDKKMGRLPPWFTPATCCRQASCSARNQTRPSLARACVVDDAERPGIPSPATLAEDAAQGIRLFIDGSALAVLLFRRVCRYGLRSGSRSARPVASAGRKI
jgi:hypothetical protein